MLSSVTKLLIVIHRWMGIVLGLVLLMWCLSGFVMMYAGSYPSLDETDRLAALKPLTGEAPVVRGMLPQSTVGRFQIEMMGDRTIARIDGDGPKPRVDELLAIAKGFDARATYIDEIERDQWTVSGDFRGSPFARFALNDGKGTWVYVSTKTGRAVQKVSRSQRILAWLGPIPHWLYPKVLRENGKLWGQVVIWSAVAGTFLTVFGLAVGVLRIRKGKLSPFKGWHLWHHLSGLVFGVLVLTWVASGLLSMNPWGLLEVKDDGEAGKLSRFSMAWADAGPTINRVLANPASKGAVQLRSSVFDQSLYVIASMKDGRQVRLDLDGNPAQFTDHDRQRVGILLGGPAELLTKEDDYYYSRGEAKARLPVIRVITPDHTRYYVDARSGALMSKMDAGGRGYRWWFEGFHRLDFTGWLRWRPLWDGLMILLLAGATGVCATGVWVGWRHLRLLLVRR